MIKIRNALRLILYCGGKPIYEQAQLEMEEHTWCYIGRRIDVVVISRLTGSKSDISNGGKALCTSAISLLLNI